MRKQIVFITIFLTIAVSSLWPNFGYAFFQEPFTAFASSFIKIGSTLDQSLSFVARSAKESVDAVKDTARNIEQAAWETKSKTEDHISKLQTKTQNLVERRYRMASLSAKTLRAKAEGTLTVGQRTARLLIGQGKHLTAGAKDAVIKNGQFSMSRFQSMYHTSIFKAREQLANIKQGALALVSSLRPREAGEAIQRSHNGIAVLPTVARNDDDTKRDIRNQPLTIIERIIEKVTVTEKPQISKNTPDIMVNNQQVNNQTLNTQDPSSFVPLSGTPQDARINSLVTNLADLTTRVDERYGISQAGGAYSNSALFNMIAQSQRIKRLDDITITNATIDGYATSKGVSDSLATYLPLGGAHSPEV